MRVLHVFNNHENMHWFIINNVDHCLKAREKELTLDSPSGSVLFRVVANMQDCMRIAGYEVSCVIWHYPADSEVKGYVQSRIRYLK